MCNSRRRSHTNPFHWLVAVALLGAGASAARADGDVDAALAKASEAFASGAWDEAKSAAESAADAAKKAGLSEDKAMAKVLVMQGAIEAAGFHNPGRAVELFRHALKLDDGVKLTKTIAKPEVIKAFKSAVIMTRTEAASAAEKADKKAEEKVEKAVEKDEKDEKKAEAKPSETKKDDKKADAKKAEEKKDEDEDEDVSLEELRRRARAAKEAKTSEGEKSEKTSDDKKRDDKKGDDKKSEEKKDKVASDEDKPAEEKKPKKKPAKKKDEPEEPDLPAMIPQPLHCPNPDDAPPGHVAMLRCVTQPGLAVTRVLLYYRLPGKEEFTSTLATKTKRGWYVMTAPAEAFQGKFMQYYFEARNASDKTIASNGKWDSPNLMLIRGDAPPVGADALALRMAGGAIVLTDENPLAAPVAVAAGRNRMWVALSVGSGYGTSGNSDLEWYADMGVPRSVPGGFRAAGPLVVAAAFGYHLADAWALSLETRNQFIFREGSDNSMPGAPASGAHSLLAKATYMRPLFPRTVLLLSGGLGFGEGARLVVPADPNAKVVEERRASSDSIRVGSALVGLAAAADVRVSRRFSIRVTLPQMLLALPKFGLVFDAGIGVVYDL